MAESAVDVTQSVLGWLRLLPAEKQQEVLDFVQFLVRKGQVNILDERQARRKASGWLCDHVSYMVGPDHANLIERNGQPVWRFGAFLTGRSHPPIGPLGYVDVDATSGEVLVDAETAEEMIRRGQQAAADLLSSKG